MALLLALSLACAGRPRDAGSTVRMLPDCPALPGADQGTQCGIVVSQARGAPAILDTLFFVRQRGAGARAARASLVFLPGGAGYPASEALELARALLGSAESAFDLLLVDHLGSGRSGGPHCTNTFKGHARYSAESAAECRGRLGGADALAQLGSVAAARHIDVVRQTLGIDRVALYGLSYGGRVALIYASLFPERVSRVVLHSPLALESGLTNLDGATERAFRQVERLCRADRSCVEAHGDLRAVRDRVLARLRTHPLHVAVADEVTFGADSVAITGRGLAGLLREELYDPENWQGVARLLTAAQRGNGRAMGPMLAGIRELDGVESLSVKLSVFCAEDLPGGAAALGSGAGSHGESPAWSSALASDLAAACRAWGPVPRQTFDSAWRVAAPILAFTGEFDPVTPPELLESVGIMAPLSTALVVAGAGHGRLWECTAELARSFLAGVAMAPAQFPPCVTPYAAWRAARTRLERP